MSDRGLYLYCLTPKELPPEALEGKGLDEGGPLFLQPHQGIAAVVSEMPTTVFSGPEAEAHMQDLKWLTPRVLRHEEVVERVLQVAPVVPARFATLFSSPEKLRRLMDAHHDAVAAFLERSTGAREWGVKLYLDRDRARQRLVEEALTTPSPSAGSPGTRYLQERRLRTQADESVRRWLEEVAGHLYETLEHRALESAQRRRLTTTSPENPGEMVANWAFLLPNQEVEAFRAAVLDPVRALRERGLSAEFAGPFPPYSFTPPLPDPDAQPAEDESGPSLL